MVEETRVEVIQADRQAAVDYLNGIEVRLKSGVKVHEVLPNEDGSPHPLALAFARHRAAFAAPPVVEVHDGWVLVPISPTRQMISIGEIALNHCSADHWGGAKAVWRAMVSHVGVSDLSPASIKNTKTLAPPLPTAGREEVALIPLSVEQWLAIEQARFLCDRLDELEWPEYDPEQTANDYMGHVDPALSRLKKTLESLANPSPIPSVRPGITLAIKWLRDLDLAEKPATQGHSAVWLAGEMERALGEGSAGEEMPSDVRRLVIAARMVAFDGDCDEDKLRELDQASEAFADRIPWDEELAS